MSRHQEFVPEDRRDPLDDSVAGPNPGDLAAEYLRRRDERLNAVAGDALRQRVEARRAAPDPATRPGEQAINPEVGERQDTSAKGVTVAGTARAVAEIPRQVAGGVGDAAREFAETTIEITDAVSKAMPEWLRAIWFAGSPAGGLSDKDRAGIDAELGKPIEQLFDEAIAALPKVDDPKTGVGAATRGLSTFLAGFIPALKLTKTVAGGAAATRGGQVVQAAIAGGFADAAVIDEQSGRLADLWRELDLPANVLTDYLASDAQDSVAEAKFKTALEGAALGVAVDAVFEGARAIRAAIILRRDGARAPSRDPLADARAEFGETTERDFLILGDPDAPLFKVEAKAPEKGGPKVRAAEKPGGAIDAEVGLLTKEDIATIGDPGAAIGGVAIKVNFARIEAAADVKAVIGQMADAFRNSVTKARRGRISHDQTAALADQLGMTVQEVLSRRKGQPFNAEEALAARRIWASSAEKLLEVARKAAGPNAGAVDQFNFRRMLAIHHAIQAEVIGARTETARSLAAWKIPAGAGVEQARAIQLLMRDMGGPAASQAMAQRLAILAAEGAPDAAISAFARRGAGAASVDAIREVWINGLLFSPKTHVVNITSNTVVALQQIAERKFAETISAAAGRAAGQGVAPGEAAAMTYGLVEGLKDAFRLSFKALRTGESGSALGKLDLPRQKSLSSEAFDLDQTGAAGRTVDFLGTVFRVPGRLLMAEDEFFKTIGYRMEVHAQAVRTATGEGLEGEALAARVADLIAHPPEHIRIASADAALYNTFTNKTGAFGEAVLKLRGDERPLSPLPFVIPFVRTPVNIARYAFERTPFAPLTRQWRDDIAAGGARRDIALARMASGSAIMLIAFDYADSGLVSGRGPKDPGRRQALRRQGWQPYSVKVGDRWFSFNRADPFGMTMGFAADIAEAIRAGEIDQDAVDEWQELVAMSIAAISQVTVNKTYLSGLSEFMEVVSDPTRYSEGYVTDLVGSFVPFSSLARAVETAVDPVQREVNDPWQAVQSRLAVLSESLTPRRDIWGEEIRSESGLGRTYDFFSPVASRPVKDSPIDAELVRLGTGIRRLGKKSSFQGVAVNFRDFPQAYDDYVRLAGNALKHPAFGLGARDLLDAVVAGRHPLSAAYKLMSDGPDGGKQAFIRNLITDYRRLAQDAVLADPAHEGFAARMSELKGTKRRARLPQQTPQIGGIPQ